MIRKLLAFSLVSCAAAFGDITSFLGAPGVQTPTCAGAPTCVIAVQTFESGMNGAFTPFATRGNSGSFSGSFSGSSSVVAANQYGGAGGNGNYLATFTGKTETLNISSSGPVPGANYFGLWVSSADAGNSFTISTTGGDYNFSGLLSTVCPTSAYCGNPNPQFLGGDPTQAFAYINFVSSPGTFINSVTFSQTLGGGFETDNVAVGFIAPEPAVSGMTIAGAGLLAGCFLLRRFRMKSLA